MKSTNPQHLMLFLLQFIGMNQGRESTLNFMFIIRDKTNTFQHKSK